MKKFLGFVLLAVFVVTGCRNETREVANIESFARMYGYVRWFHPSDQTGQIDWDRFAVLGVRKVKDAKNDDQLRGILYELFSPLVPGLDIYRIDNPGTYDLSTLMPEGENHKVVFWQHMGVNLGNSNIYQSFRITDIPSTRSRKPVKAYEILKDGAEIKLSAWCRTELNDPQSIAELFFVFFNENDEMVIDREDVQTAYVNSPQWQKYELTHTVPARKNYLGFGFGLEGNGVVWADDFEVSIKEDGKWVKLEGITMDFANDMMRRRDNLSSMVYDHEIIDDDVSAGRKCMRISYRGRIFDREVQFGEYINEPISKTLGCRIPMALYKEGSATFPSVDMDKFNALKAEINNVSLSDKTDPIIFQGSVVITWNVVQHFFPYFDVIDTDWQEVLPVTLAKAGKDRHKKEFYITLCEMIALIDDGHGIVSNEEMYHLPLKMAIAENHIVVAGSKTDLLKVGDIIVKIDGLDAMAALEEVEKTVSGSPHLKRHRSLNILGSKYDKGSTILEINRNGEAKKVTVPTDFKNKSMFYNTAMDPVHPVATMITEPEPGIFYVDLSGCTPVTFNSMLDELAGAKAVIYDNRVGGELNFLQIIPHMIDDAVNSAWWEVPEVVHPDRKGMVFDSTNWDVKPQLPRFRSQAIILNNPSVVSFGETQMGMIDNYGLAITVGEPTAGCNGNVNRIELPSGHKVWFTGMKVRKHDGSQLYGIGFVPDYPVENTIDDILNGRDAVLEKALEVAREL